MYTLIDFRDQQIAQENFLKSAKDLLTHMQTELQELKENNLAHALQKMLNNKIKTLQHLLSTWE